MSGLEQEHIFCECISHILRFNVCMWAADVSHKTKSDGSAGNVMFSACGRPISDPGKKYVGVRKRR